MSKVQYLDLLKKKLAFADGDFVESLIADFEAHFESGFADGLSEEEIISHLGDIDEIVESLDVKDVYINKGESVEKLMSGKVNHMVVDGKFADVTFTPSLNDKIEVNMLNKGGLLSKFSHTMIGEQKGDVFEVRVLPLFNVKSNVDMKISVTLPSHLLSCRVMTSSGDVVYSGISFDGDCSITTASGDVSVTDCTNKNYEFKIASGDLKFSRNVGDIRIKSASGDVVIKEGRGADFECSLASGDLSVQGFYQKVNVKAVSGDVNLEMSDGKEFSISTVSGDGRVHLKNMGSIRFDFSSVSGFCTIKESVEEHKLKNQQHLVLKDGDIPCKISTVNGKFEVNMG
ncbi:MAG: DUF4097 family beta strand repeat-containing protein [Erysipelotrichaceae bacterium]|nr:DUF4097 family beta strand repeat-containing protein [Erysipelotrichaceae bacterium]